MSRCLYLCLSINYFFTLYSVPFWTICRNQYLPQLTFWLKNDDTTMDVPSLSGMLIKCHELSKWNNSFSLGMDANNFAEMDYNLLMIFAIAQMASLVAQLVKSPTTMRETWVRSLGQKYPLEKEMATHSSIPAWRIPWRKDPGGLQCMGVTESDTTKWPAFTVPRILLIATFAF